MTGSMGFIGKALCRELRRRGVEVIGIDRKEGKEASDIGGILEKGGVDCVFHLAAQTSVFNGRLEDIRKDNIDTFMEVAVQCRRHGVKLVYASSSTANPCNTTSMYGISKGFDEMFAKIYCPSATGCRLHNVYGPDQRQGTLLWHLQQGGTVLYNGGRNIRCFTFIDDVVEGLLYAMGCGLRLVNIVNLQPVTTEQFASIVKRHTGIGYALSEEVRTFDNSEQSVDKGIFLVPLSYTPVDEGLRRIFDGTDNKNG